MMNISIHCCGNDNHTRGCIVCLKVLGEVQAISQAGCGSNKNKTSKAKARGILESRLLVFLRSKLVCTSTDVIVSAKIDIIGEVFPCHNLRNVANETIYTINEAN